jgi:hypothetical protein
MQSIAVTLSGALDKRQMFVAQSGFDAHGRIGECIKMRSGQNVNAEVVKDMRRLWIGSASGLMSRQISLGTVE